MAKKRKKTKKKSSNSSNALSKVNYIKQAARKLKVLECLAIPGWEELGIAQVVVARQKPNGAILAGVYVVDIFCLGIKNTLYQIFDLEEDYRDFLEFNLKGKDEMIEIEAQLAFNLIYGAMEYAEDLGFEPHRDFKLTEYILPAIEEVEYMEIEFGKDGKPFYISGPFDNVDKIMNTLSKNVGADNFGYVAHVDSEFFEEMEDADFEMNQYLPMEVVAAKSEKMNEENQTAFQIQIFIAGGILKQVEGDFSKLEDEPDFFDEIIESVMYNAVKSEMFGEKLEDDLEEFMERNVVFILEKMIEYRSVDFLLEEDYLPVPKMLTEEEFGKMSEAEHEAYSKKVSKTMTRQENSRLLLEEVFLNFLQEDIENGIAVPKSIEDADDYFEGKIEKLREVIFKEEGIDEELEIVLREYFNDALESFLEDDGLEG